MKVDPRKRPRRYGWVISQVFISHVAHTKRDRRNRRTFMKRDREKRRTSMKRDLEKRRTSMKRDLWQWPIAMSIDPRKRPRRHEYVMSLKFRSHITLMKRDRRKRRTSMKRELRKRPVSMKIDARKTPRRCVKWLKEFLFFFGQVTLHAFHQSCHTCHAYEKSPTRGTYIYEQRGTKETYICGEEMRCIRAPFS